MEFISSFSPEPNTGCWLWMAHCNRRGYGQFYIDRKPIAAHVASWMLFRNSVRPSTLGLFVCHRCDTPSCVNPDHLFLGTHQDNMDDKVRKGRTSAPRGRGENHISAKLTQAQVGEIRRRYRRGNGAELCREFGLAHNAVSDIIRGKTWRAA